MECSGKERNAIRSKANNKTKRKNKNLKRYRVEAAPPPVIYVK